MGQGSDLGTAKGRLEIDVTQLEAARAAVAAFAAGVNTNLTGVNKSAGVAQTGITGLASAAGALGFSVGVAGAVLLGRKFLQLGADSVQSSSDLTESINKVNVAFAGSSKNVLAWSKNSAAALGQSRQQALEASGGFGLMFGTMGIGTAKAAEMSEAMVQLAADLASINNVAPAEALTKLKAGLVGEVEPLRTMGVLLDEATVKAKAMEMGLASTESALTSQDKVLARYALILEQTTKQQGDFARTSDQLANQERILQAHLGDLSAEFGDSLTPAVETTVKALNDLFGIMTQIRESGPLIELPAWMTADPLGDFLRNNHFTGDITGRTGNSPYPFFAPNVTTQDERGLNAATQGASVRAGRKNAAANAGEFSDIEMDWARGVTELAHQTNEDLLNENTNYSRQRLNAEQEYQEALSRDAQQFALGRQRAEADHAKAIADIQEGAAQREQRMAEDLARATGRARSDSAKRIADMEEELGRTIGQRRADSADKIAEWTEDRDRSTEERRKASIDRLAELEQDYNREREEREAQYKLSREEAIANSDGRALRQLERRHEVETQQADEAHSERIKDEQEQLEKAIEQINSSYAERLADERQSLDKSIQQARDAYERQAQDEREALAQRIADAAAAYQQQLEDARAADAQRIADMEADFTLRKTREDEDRGIRLGQLKADNDRQLAEMDKTHGERITQIERHAADERAKLDEEAQAGLIALGARNVAWLAEQAKKETAMERLWDLLMGHMTSSLEDINEAKSLLDERGRVEQQLTGIPSGTSDWIALRDRLNEIDARLKELANGGAPSVASISNVVSASRINSPASGGAIAAGAGGLSIGQISFTITGVAGQTAQDLYAVVEQCIFDTVKRAAKAYQT